MLSPTRQIRHEKMKEIFSAALELTADERSDFVSQVCGGDEVLRSEIESLLQARDEAGKTFLEDISVVAAIHDSISRRENLIGEKIDRYRIEKEIGRGGMGVVFLATREDFQQKVALKLIKRGMDSEAVLERFAREREILASLNHPFIAKLLDGGTTSDDAPYFVMEYVEGVSIDDYCRDRKLTKNEKLELFRKICSAVSFAHQKLIVHRDLKPSNILVTADGTPKLLDFGIAKLLNDADANSTQTNQRLLTPAYASPEQIKGEPVDTTSDVFSLGVILKKILQPEDDQTNRQSLKTSNQNPAKHHNGDTDLQAILQNATRVEPSRRYNSVEKFSEDVRRYLTGLPVTARKDTFAYRASKFLKRNRLAAAAFSAVFITLAGGIVATSWEAHLARTERARAERRFNDVRQITNSFMFELNDEIQKGPTKAREMLVKKALKYLDDLAQEADTDPSLQLELATAYARVGDIQGQPYHPNLGDSVGALASYGKAKEILESLSSSGANNPDNLESLCLIYQKTGWLKTRVGDWDAALENGLKEVKTAELLTESDKTNPKYLSLLSAGHLLVGVGTYGGVRGDSIEANRQALENFRQAVTIDEDLYKADSKNSQLAYSVLSGHSYAGYALWKIGDLSGDAENYQAALSDFRRNKELGDVLFKAEPDKFRRTKADSMMDYGTEQIKLGDLRGALETSRQALAIFEEVSATDPNNVEARRDVADGYRNVSAIAAKLKDFSAALAESRKALAVYEYLYNLDPANTENQSSIVITYNAISDSLDGLKNWSEAQDNRLKAKNILEKLLQDNSSGAQTHHLLANEEEAIAQEYENLAAEKNISTAKRQENRKHAAEWFQRSLVEWQQIQQSGQLSSLDARKLEEISIEAAKCVMTLQSINR